MAILKKPSNFYASFPPPSSKIFQYLSLVPHAAASPSLGKKFLFTVLQPTYYWELFPLYSTSIILKSKSGNIPLKATFKLPIFIYNSSNSQLPTVNRPPLSLPAAKPSNRKIEYLLWNSRCPRIYLQPSCSSTDYYSLGSTATSLWQYIWCTNSSCSSLWWHTSTLPSHLVGKLQYLNPIAGSF